MHENPVVGLFYFPNTRKLSIWSMTRKEWMQYGAMSPEPLPPGQYFVGASGHHAQLGDAAPLFPQCGTAGLPEDWCRSGLFIHGSSGKSSAPGIVPFGIAITDLLGEVETLRAIWSDRLAIKVLPGAVAIRQQTPSLALVPA